MNQLHGSITTPPEIHQAESNPPNLTDIAGTCKEIYAVASNALRLAGILAVCLPTLIRQPKSDNI
jgi:hypothetical protein